MATVKFKKLDARAILPTYGSAKAAGMDLYALEDCLLQMNRVTMVRTGIAVQLPEGYEAQVRPRSGNAAKFGVTVLNTPGTIDEDYRGEIMVIAVKLATDKNGLTAPYQVKAGDRIAQLVVKKVEYHEVVEIEDFDAPETERGSSGFGSTGA